MFSVLGVALAVIGVYGVIAESVAARVREIGVRMALGAQPTDIVIMVVRQGTWIIAAGIVVGLVGALHLRIE